MNTGKRLSHIKPWRGCQFCRQSKVWCDEGRPACRNCVKYRRVCLYGPPTDTKGQQLPHAKQSPPDTRPLPGSQSSTFPLEKDDSASHTTLASASITPSLDPYSQSLLPLSPARRALLAFCKTFSMLFLVKLSTTGSLQADRSGLKIPRK